MHRVQPNNLAQLAATVYVRPQSEGTETRMLSADSDRHETMHPTKGIPVISASTVPVEPLGLIAFWAIPGTWHYPLRALLAQIDLFEVYTRDRGAHSGRWDCASSRVDLEVEMVIFAGKNGVFTVFQLFWVAY
uniref:Uncharacterized protein n=1 Tax=Ananas comosus var. bracteatus TaxID=296719 RepID=A0A6V7PWX2_ANACO|nr:unnamed protein product [Ananas comosus var. bracteatus]